MKHDAAIKVLEGRIDYERTRPDYCQMPEEKIDQAQKEINSRLEHIVQLHKEIAEREQLIVDLQFTIQTLKTLGGKT